MATKKELSQAASQILPMIGMRRIWKMDTYRATPTQSRALSDEGWMGRGYLLFIEIKSDNDSLSSDQEKLWCHILGQRHNNRNIFYIVLAAVEQLEKIAEIINVGK